MQVEAMKPGARVAAFVSQLLDDEDEEVVVSEGILPEEERKQRTIVDTTDSNPNSARPSTRELPPAGTVQRISGNTAWGAPVAQHPKRG